MVGGASTHDSDLTGLPFQQVPTLIGPEGTGAGYIVNLHCAAAETRLC